MNLILVSGRHAEPETHLDADAEFARELHKAGCSVRWITPAPRGAVIRTVQGVRVIAVESKAPGFAAVVGRVRDIHTESALNHAIRDELPDLVHVLDYGGANSVNLMWISDRMGVPAIVSLHSAPTVCHRGDLQHADGSMCEDFLDPQRCATCCLTPSADGLSRIGSAIGRLLVAVRSPICPFPSSLAFADRLELIAGGLQSASRVVVSTERDRDRVVTLGVPEDIVQVATPGTGAEWLAWYDASLGAEAGAELRT